jgi:8-oxo-dGTP pyrophosphatase MutT (NUDIX family)
MDDMPTIVSNIVEVYIFRILDGMPQYLLLKRAASDPLYAGIWQVVTGTLEDSETAVAGAQREAAEETGLSFERVWTVPGIGAFYDAAHDAVNLCPLFAAQAEPGKEPRLSREHEMYGWFEHERARAFLVWPSQKASLDVVHQFIAGQAESASLTRLR